MTELALVLLGGTLTLACAWGLGRLAWLGRPPAEPLAFATGAALLSLAIFACLAAGVAGKPAFLALAAPGLCGLLWRRPRLAVRWEWAAAPAAAYLLLYTVHALAPEIEPDGAGYHLGLVAEWLRLGRFPDRVGFYDALPQGLEMLFGMAYAFGGGSAAKLVHFGFLAVSVPLLLGIAARLEVSRTAAWGGTLLYLAAPVVGVAGSSSYTDAAFALCCLALFRLLLEWETERRLAPLVCAGLLAGFCYAIKLNGLLVLAPAGLFLLWRRAWAGALAFAAAALATIAPWMLRAFLATGNPLAPLSSALFPNPYFHLDTERQLSHFFRNYGVASWGEIPLSLTFGGQTLQGLIGPAFLLAPLALWSLRSRAGRWLLAAAAALAAAYPLNIGARFLIPALPFLALAMAAALPRRWPLALGLAQAVLCWPAVVDLYAAPGAWRLQETPWRAALRLEPEEQYLRRRLFGYRYVELTAKHVRPGERLLDLHGIPYAYLGQTPLGMPPNAEFDILADTLALAAREATERFFLYEVRWKERYLSGLRLRLRQPDGGSWSVQELTVLDGAARVPMRPGWSVSAWPLAEEAPFAFDANPATRWRPWQPAAPGMFVELIPSRAMYCSGANALLRASEGEPRMDLYGRTLTGEWSRLSVAPVRFGFTPARLRESAGQALQRAGITWVLAPAGDQGYGIVGKNMSREPEAWGLSLVDRRDGVFLFRVP